MSEEWIHDAAAALVRLVEAGAALIIFAGTVLAFVRLLARVLRIRPDISLTSVRLDLGRFLSLGLDFQLAADLLRTAVAPTFEEIGKLAAVAAIRTALNYFLEREIKGERSELANLRRET